MSIDPTPGTTGGRGIAHDHLESIDRDECLRRLRARGVGRLGVLAAGGVEIFPVNYVVDGDSIVMRVRRGGVIDDAAPHAPVALEIDDVDGLSHEGWSVLVGGACTEVLDPAERDAASRLPLEPWADDERDLWLRLAMESVTGRHIHHRAVDALSARPPTPPTR